MLHTATRYFPSLVQRQELASELYRLVDQSKSEVRTELAKALKAGLQTPEHRGLLSHVILPGCPGA